jgi:hypothetical protein
MSVHEEHGTASNLEDQNGGVWRGASTLHRSITFWSGLLIIAFLCWAWWDSFAYHSHATRSEFKISHHAGGIEICRDRFGDPFGPFPGSDSVDRFAIRHTMIPSSAIQLFQAPFFIRGRDGKDPVTLTIIGEPVTYREFLFDAMAWSPRGDWVLFLPHWLLLLVIAIPWLALLAWRARRRSGKV